jgi:hypothetical protein
VAQITTLNMHDWLALVGKNCSLIQGKVGGIQVLAGLALSSQTVGSNKEILKPPFKVAPLMRASCIIAKAMQACGTQTTKVMHKGKSHAGMCHLSI